MRVILIVLAALCVACGNGESGAPGAPTSSVPNPEPYAVLVGAGDIGWCGSLGCELTALLLDSIPGTVFTAGDNAYPDGSYDDYLRCYDPFWGRHKHRTRPVPGNHEYETPGARGYFDYFGSQAGPDTLGYYDFTAGSWHVLALNSNIRGSEMTAQLSWLRTTLAATSARCAVAIWHHPLFSSGKNGDTPRMRPLWRALEDARTELVLVGHDHLYERFAPQTADGVSDAGGIRQVVVGTGGAAQYPFVTERPNSEARIANRYGVLKLTLYDGRYVGEFVTSSGVADQFSGTCH